jgi:hypothetical protein
VINGNPHASDAWLAAHLARFDGNDCVVVHRLTSRHYPSTRIPRQALSYYLTGKIN